MDGQTKQADGRTVRQMEQTDRQLTNTQIEETDKCTDRRQTEWCTEWVDSAYQDEDTKGCIFKTTMNCVWQNNQSDYVMLWV